LWREGSATVGKLRLLFVKEGRAGYISHLDLLRTFQRVFLRQGMVLRHSQGFHPHPIISFALPLSVGQESVCELLDLETVEDLDCAALPGRLAVDVAQAQTAAEASEVIRQEVNKVLKEISQYKYDPLKYEERVRKRMDWDSIMGDTDDDSG